MMTVVFTRPPREGSVTALRTPVLADHPACMALGPIQHARHSVDSRGPARRAE
jgi:hypothetical protein